MEPRGVAEAKAKEELKLKQFSLVLPVLFYEYLSISITKSLIPTLLVNEFHGQTYLILGMMETVKGLLAFISCPLFGKLSDQIGRKYCLLVSVTGTTLPVGLLVFTDNMYVFVVTTGLSGFFSATFPLTFAYISDCVSKKKRAPAYGLALATFGLSFCIGPIAGSYVATQFGNWAVFALAFSLVIFNVFYILTVLPETASVPDSTNKTSLERLGVAMEYLPNTWNLSETFRVFNSDDFMTNLALIVFLYYTSVWAIVSTLVVHVTRQLQFTKVELGWLLSGYGLATMVSLYLGNAFTFSYIQTHAYLRDCVPSQVSTSWFKYTHAHQVLSLK
jgi:MFS family permease